MGRVALCWKCGHETRRHQPSWASKSRGHETMVGCGECNCLLTMLEKLRYWQVIG